MAYKIRGDLGKAYRTVVKYVPHCPYLPTYIQIHRELGECRVRDGEEEKLNDGVRIAPEREQLSTIGFDRRVRTI